jgi:dihydroorotase
MPEVNMIEQKSRIAIRRPDDLHLHLRDGAMLKLVTADSSRDFARAIIMPNLVPPVANRLMAAAYKDRILAAVPEGHDFHPLMTIYLTEETDSDDLEAGFKSGLVKAAKLYPAGATTNSDSGVKTIENIYPVLERMAKIGMPVLVHGEVTDPAIDIFDREAVFIDRVLAPLRKRIPELRIVMEHVTTKDGVDYVRDGGDNLAATLTTHHLIINRNHILVGGIKPHYYCLPVAKREEHRLALVEAATSGNSSFFLGTDSAPHATDTKENACGCAGCYTSVNTLPCLAHVFEAEGALDKLELFTSINGASFYGLPLSESLIHLVKQDEAVKFPSTIGDPALNVTVFDPGFPLHWGVER